jgi:two-component system chemotaxis response regulator CheY
MRALVVDDSRAVRLFIGNILRELGGDVFEASNGQEGLKQLAENPDIELMLVDWNMPVMDGLEFIRTVRRSGTWDHAKIMMVTTETESERVQLAINSGANEYLMKPFTKDVLIAKLTLLDVFQE